MVDGYSFVRQKWWIFPMIGGLVFILILYLCVFRAARQKRKRAALLQHQLENGLPTIPDAYTPGRRNGTVSYTVIETDADGQNRATFVHNNQAWTANVAGPMRGNMVAPQTGGEDASDALPPAYNVAVTPPPKAYEGAGNPSHGSNPVVDVTSGTQGTQILSSVKTTETVSLGRTEDNGFWGRFQNRKKQVAEGRQRELESSTHGTSRNTGDGGTAYGGPGDLGGDGGGHSGGGGGHSGGGGGHSGGGDGGGSGGGGGGGDGGGGGGGD